MARKNRRRWCGSMERVRCNACGDIFTAIDPPAAGPEKFDPTAVATTALLKYGTGMPFHRLEQLEKHLGIPFPASVQWELMKRAAGWLRPVLKELIRHAAQGGVMHNDDTGMRILQMARGGGGKVRCHRRGHDRAFEIRHGHAV